MEALKLLEKYPLSTEVVREWFINKMVESVKGDDTVPEDFKNYMLEQGIPNDKLCIFIDSSPRSLFDAFDENDIIIYFMIFSSPEGVRFSPAIHTGNNEVKPNTIGDQYKTRKEAELVAVEKAFEILEQQLTHKENTDENE
jgi:hypothetical protein